MSFVDDVVQFIPSHLISLMKNKTFAQLLSVFSVKGQSTNNSPVDSTKVALMYQLRRLDLFRKKIQWNKFALFGLPGLETVCIQMRKPVVQR